MAIASINPATGETLRTFDPLDARAIEERLELAQQAFARHRRTSFDERARHMTAAADLLEQEREPIARIVTLEVGKPIQASRDEVTKCAAACRFYAANAASFLAPDERRTGAERSYIRFDPLGPVLAIMPWNFPLWQVFRFAAPAIMAGNVGLLKHAGNVPQCALKIEEVFVRAGFEQGVFQTLLIEADQTASIIDDSRIKAVTLTGSERAGADVASRAARVLKKSVLELGGSDPFIVMPGADLEKAAEIGVRSRTLNAGQSCIAAKRFIVAAEIYDDYIGRFVERMRALRVGDPFDETTDVGPLATASIRDGLDEQVRRSVDEGARVLVGGRTIDRPGFFYEPTVLADVPRKSVAACEEIFGPVAAFFRARDKEEALEIANDTTFGLGATVWTNDPAEQEFFAQEIEAGMVFVNGMVASDPRIPFGGVKRSGYGRELSAEGIREFVNLKTVVVN